MPDDFPSSTGPVQPLNSAELSAATQLPETVQASCEPLDITEFLETPDPLITTEHVIESRLVENRRPPGPGLPEALGWTFGVFASHLFATVVLLVVVVGFMLVSGELQQGHAPDLEDTSSPYMLLLIGGDQMIVLLISLLAASLRFAPGLMRVLNLTPPHPLHIAIVTGLVLPLSSLSGEVYRLTHLVWMQMIDVFPALAALDEMNTVEMLQDISSIAPLPLMLLIIAVGPALAEELVFRGVIGRGLVARWGVPMGVLITSCLFAVVHMHPVHVVAVIPLGIAMHLIYLATRSFWAPVLLHFLNNSWATVASRMSSGESFDELAMEASLGPGLLVASAVAVVVLGTLLYHTRTRYRLADGSEWNPGYVTTELPPAHLAVTVDRGIWSGRAMATAATAWAAFAVAFVAELVAYARG
ncbi:CPBP family intramembrane metalloprotease [bacterium]|nr:CPBP family intramembrane metalloprotease [bacterium]